MDRKEFNLNNRCDDGGGGAGGPGRGDGFIDRSKVRILLCESDPDSSKEVFTLLLKCSYQVVAVRSARQVIDALNAEGPDIDIILADLDLPTAKGMKMLKYITRDKELRRIPVIMMSAQDEVSIVVKCLRLGAADYLVKPLRTNELLNLWTHMWRRRRTLGLAEKNILNYEFDVVVSDPSDANSNSTTLFSDDTDDKARKNTNTEIGASTLQEDEENATAATSTAIERHIISSDCQLERDISGQQAVHFSPGPLRSELRIGESSAFLSYVKSSIIRNSLANARAEANAAQQSRTQEKHQDHYNSVADETCLHENGKATEISSPGEDMPGSCGIPDSVSMERSTTPPAPKEHAYKHSFSEERFSNAQVIPRNGAHHQDSLLPAQSAYPYCMPGMVNQVMVTSSGQVCQKNLHEMQNQVMMPQYNQIQQCPPHMNGMASFPYYPLNMCLQPGQMPQPHSWQSYGGSPSNEVKTNKVDRREAALIKFRQKRKERCFDKKIRYVNRKRLAERRPRIRGQFVRKVNGVDVDLNGHPTSGDYDEDEEDDETLGSMESTPDDNGTRY